MGVPFKKGYYPIVDTVWDIQHCQFLQKSMMPDGDAAVYQMWVDNDGVADEGCATWQTAISWYNHGLFATDDPSTPVHPVIRHPRHQTPD